jgi:uncharacterized membrane protein YesL
MERAPAPLRVILEALADWWGAWVQMAIAGLIVLLCWLTLLLGPPATFGLYHWTYQLAHGRNPGLGGWVEGGRRYLLKSWLWFVLNLIGIGLALLNVWFYGHFEATWAALLQMFFLVLGVIWCVVQFYTLPYFMEQEEKSLRLALRNGLFTALAAPGFTFLVVGMALIVVVLSLGLVVPLFLGGPGLVAALGSRAVRDRVEAYQVRERDAARRDERSDEL